MQARLPTGGDSGPWGTVPNVFSYLQETERYPPVLRSHTFLNDSREKLIRKTPRIEEPIEGKKVTWVPSPFKAHAHPPNLPQLWQVVFYQGSLPHQRCSRSTNPVASGLTKEGAPCPQREVEMSELQAGLHEGVMEDQVELESSQPISHSVLELRILGFKGTWQPSGLVGLYSLPSAVCLTHT